MSDIGEGKIKSGKLIRSVILGRHGIRSPKQSPGQYGREIPVI